MRYWAKEVQKINTWPLKKTGFQNVFAKNPPAENFRLPKISAPVNYNATNAAKQKANGSRKYVSRKRARSVRVRKRTEQWGMSHLLLFQKFSKSAALFLTETDRKNMQKTTQHAAQPDGAPSINAKSSSFPSFLYILNSKIYPLTFKNSEN